MVDKSKQLDLVFRALSDPTRRAMLDRMRSGERSIVELAAPFEMTLAGAAKHVTVLDRANLITRRKIGRTQYCQLNPKAMEQAFRWMDRYAAFWNKRLDKLESLLKSEKKRRGKKK